MADTKEKQNTTTLGEGFSTNSYMRLPESAIEALCRRYVVRLGGNPDIPETHHSHQRQHFERLFDQLAVLAQMGLLPVNLKPLPPLTLGILGHSNHPDIKPTPPDGKRIVESGVHVLNPEALPNSDGNVSQKTYSSDKKQTEIDEFEKASIEAAIIRNISWFRPLPLVRFSSYEYESFAVIGKIHGKNLLVEKGWFGEYVNVEHQTSAIKQAAHERARKKASITVHSYSPPVPPMPPRPKPKEGKFDPHASGHL
jgi:hypothetical protein